jgi:hypothetical protein
MKLPLKLFRRVRPSGLGDAESEAEKPQVEPSPHVPDRTQSEFPPRTQAKRIELRRAVSGGSLKRREAAADPAPAEDRQGKPAALQAKPSRPDPKPVRRSETTPPPSAPGSGPRPTRGRPAPAAQPARQPQPRTAATKPSPPIRGYGRRAPAPAEPEQPLRRNPKELKTEAELRHEMGPTMQYDDPT